MPTISIALESILFCIAGGTFLAVAVAVGLKTFANINAATRCIVWSAALVTLPLLLPIYFFSHLPTAGVARSRQQVAPITPIVSTTPTPTPYNPSDNPPNNAPSAVKRQLQIGLPDHFAQVLFAAYLAIVTLLFVRLLISYARLRLLRRRTQPAPSELTARLCHRWLTRCPTSRPVELRISQYARSPLAIGFLKPVIVMPAGLVLDFTQQEYDNLGVHELAHIRRFDDWTNLIQRILQAILCFHPAAHYICRKLSLEREIACDDWVVAAGESKSYARCLTKVVELRRYQRGALLLSSGAFFGKRQIVQRVESLLDKTRNAVTSVSSVVVLCTVLGVAALAMQIVHLPAVIAFTQDEAGATTSSRWSDGSRDLRIKLRGDITFSNDEQSIAAISPSGFFILDEAKGWSHRRLEVRAAPDGTLEEKYFLDGVRKPLDGVGRAWAASNYLFALRDLGIDSEPRVRRILADSGPSGVLDEVNLIHSDHVKCDYLNHLLEQTTLSNRDLQRVTDSLRKVSSDNDKADFLIAHALELTDDQVRTSYFSAINTISSDNDRRRVLTHLLETAGHDPETARLVAQSAKRITSNHDKAEVLLAIPATASTDARCGLLNAARTISSDNDKARVLRDAAYTDTPACRDAWFAVANLISSDNDRSNVLQSLLQKDNLQPETYRELADSAKGMHSDNDKANVLVLMSGRYRETPFFEAVKSISSEDDRGRILKAVVENKPSKADLLSVIASSIALNDDNRKTEILLEIAKQSRDTEVTASLKKACEKLSSDNDYRRVATALLND